MRGENNKSVFIPFMISQLDSGSKVVKQHIPIGDGILTYPIIKETGDMLYIPPGFSGDLLAYLFDDIDIVRDLGNLKPETKCNTTVLNLFNNKEHPLSIKKWGSQELISRFGPINATQCIAMAMGIKLKDPVPKIKRPAEPINHRVIFFPKGSCEKRSLNSNLAKDIVNALKDNGLDPVVADKKFDDPVEYAHHVASAEYAIGVLTGPTHMAAAMGLKTLALCVGDSPYAYRPLQKNSIMLAEGCDKCWFDPKSPTRTCGESLPRCQKALSPELILTAMKEFDRSETALL